MAERTHPAQLRQPALQPPVVDRAREQLPRFIAEHRARVRPQVLDVVLGKPALDFGQRVAVLFGVLLGCFYAAVSIGRRRLRGIRALALYPPSTSVPPGGASGPRGAHDWRGFGV